jgi:hypothetical protein
MQNVSYAIVPLRDDFLRRARDAGLDDQGQRVERHLAVGGEPLRDVLRGAAPGEPILLASYCPFTIAGPYKEFGPVYVLAEAEAEAGPLAAAPASLPLGAPGNYLTQAFVLRAYCVRERIVDAVLTTPAAAELALRALLRRADVHFVLARFGAYGCYACRIERRHGAGAGRSVQGAIGLIT